MRLLRLAVLLVLAVPGVLRAQNALPPALVGSIDSVIGAAMEKQHIPGLALGVVKNGRLVLAKGYGLANVELNVPVTPTTVFKIGSVSKQFLASGIMMLVQDGKLRLDDPISRHVPGTPDSWKGITIRHFLDHTSGVLREGPAFQPLKVKADSVVVASAFEKPLEFSIGAKWQYCNVCYFTIADIIRRVSGQLWPDFIRDRIFAPSGMTDSRTTTTTELVPRRADGYGWKDGSFVPAPEYLALRPSGAFLSTVVDLAKWDSVLTAKNIITEASWKEMAAPAKLANGSKALPSPRDTTIGYGLGWMTGELKGHEAVGHGGSLPGFRSQMTRYPGAGWAVIVLTNGQGANPTTIERDVASLILGPD